MSVDTEGYGARPDQTPLARLLEDSRTLSPAGIERVATGWDRRGTAESFEAAERVALHALESSGKSTRWDQLRNEVLGLTERGQPLVAWRAEHGAVGHKAEGALLAAVLALLAGDDVDRSHSETLRRPMAEALPWLLPGVVEPPPPE